MKRLLIVATISATLRSFLLPYAQHFRAQGWRVDALSNDSDRCAVCKANFDHTWSVNWSRNPLDPANLLSAPWQVKRLVEEQGYDIVHVHTPVAALVTRYALRGPRQGVRPKVVYTAHGFHFHRGGGRIANESFLALERIASAWTDYLVVMNREDEEMARRYHLASHGAVHYMPGIGVDTSYYAKERISDDQIAGVRHDLGLCDQEPLFLMIAEFNRGKRHSDILYAFRQLAHPSAHLAFAGTGPLLPEVKALAASLGLSHRTHFLGYRTDIPVLLRTSVANVLPSEREGLPRSLMESMSLEIPVIGTDIRGVRDLLEDNRGLMVPVGRPEDLARAMARVLDQPSERLEMVRRAREFIVRCDTKRILALHDELYSRALNEPGSERRRQNGQS